MTTSPLDANDPEQRPSARGPRPSASARAGGAVRRIRGAWGRLAGDERLAALAALGLFIVLLLPWYSTTSPVTKVVNGKLQATTASATKSGILTFGWVEAAVLLVALAVLWLLFARAEGRAFHLPGGDGGVIVAAGAWVAFLIVWRFFDRPDLGRGVAVGLQWGIFIALVIAVALGWAGTRVRAAQRPEPPLERAAEPATTPSAPGTEVTRPLADAPLRPPKDRTAATGVHRGEPAPDDPTSALPRRRDEG
jgi:hypothetical protein